MGRTRILLADDHTSVCAGLAKLLERHYEIIGIVEDGRDATQSGRELKPDFVLLDIGMPLLKWPGRGARTKTWMPQVKLNFLTVGSNCYIAAELLQAVRDAMRGALYISPQIGRANGRQVH